MYQQEDATAKPIIDRLVEETISREGKISQTGMRKLPSGYELAGKIEGAYYLDLGLLLDLKILLV